MSLDFKFYWSIFWRRLPYFLLVTVLITATGVSLAVILPPKYRAAALLLVESEQIPGNLAESTVHTGTGEQLQLIEQQLLTRTNLIDLANRLGIYSETPGFDPSAVVTDMRDRINFDAKSSRGQATTLAIGFIGSDPDQALEVTNALVTQVLEMNVEMRTGRATETLEFFRQEVERLGTDLSQQGAEILAFQTAHRDSLSDSLDYRRRRQASLQERLVQLQREQAAQTDRRLRLVTLYEQTGRIETDGKTDKNSPESQLAAAQAGLADALLIYSEQNPKVKLLKTRVAALEKLVAEQASASGVGGAEGGQPSLYEVQLAEIDGEIGYLGDEIAGVEAEIQTLQTTIEDTPANDAQLTEMERAQNITKDQYGSAVKRLAAAQTGERIEVLSKGQRITVVEQPVRPSSAYSPQRKLIAAASLALGLLLGVALVVLLEALNRSVRRPAEITARLGITPIATLPFVRTRYETKRRRAILASAFFFAVFGVWGGLYAVHVYYIPMDLLVERVINRTGLASLLGGLTQRFSG